MERNVESWGVALRQGFEPKRYTYDPDQIPQGVMVATLDFKTWSKRIIAINCYFTKVDTGSKFVITVYCNNRTAKYSVTNSPIDFATCVLNRPYTIELGKNPKGVIVLMKADDLV